MAAHDAQWGLRLRATLYSLSKHRGCVVSRHLVLVEGRVSSMSKPMILLLRQGYGMVTEFGEFVSVSCLQRYRQCLQWPGPGGRRWVLLPGTRQVKS